MSQGEQSRFALGHDGQRSDHVESEQAQHGEVFLTDGFVFQVRADQTKTPQRSRACTKRGQRRWRGLGAGANQDVLHGSAPGDDQSDGPANLEGELGESFCRFR